MEYSNFYDLKSLVRLNEREGRACSIEERDVEKVNRLISRMRKEREENPAPVAGDTVTYTTRGGDYYPQAHIERSDGREAQLCLLPRMPFLPMRKKDGPVITRKEGLGLRQPRDYYSGRYPRQTVPDMGAYRKTRERRGPVPHIRQGMEIYGT